MSLAEIFEMKLNPEETKPNPEVTVTVNVQFLVQKIIFVGVGYIQWQDEKLEFGRG